MANQEPLVLSISKRKHLGSFLLRIKNNMGFFRETVKVLSEDGVIDKNTAYELEKTLQKLIVSVKEKLQQKALNWNIVFNQESFIECENALRQRVYKISEEEIDTVFNMVKIMDENPH